ncbi:acylphosphatase [Natronoglycomyces albus]|uniref:Acylphosphatase n=1 Tax=Natronoglycomyces albus TaxID=2811108 RepID=A0A895XN47_9ACTN|nr:acylphosphatase [Natronoglycomyces albus]QSB04819.1 acylphosphatase [Natronoglycomyces albus]
MSPTEYLEEFVPGGSQTLKSVSLREARALQMGLSVRTYDAEMMMLEQPGYAARAGFYKLTDQTVGRSNVTLTGDKGITRDQLQLHGLPIARGMTFGVNDKDAMLKQAPELGYPLVVKPSNGSKGQDITTGITSVDELGRAFDLAAAGAKARNGVVVEQHIDGDDYRLLTLDGIVVSVLRREPGSTYGDGVSTVLELVIAANAARQRNPHLRGRLVKIDANLDRVLAKQGLNLQSVPSFDQAVTLVQVANISQGGSSTEVLHETHSSVLELAGQAARVLGMPQAGVDILMPDHRRPVDEQRLTITEVNSNSDLNMHTFPCFGKAVEISEPVVRNAARGAGMRPTELQPDPAVRLTIFGHVQGVGFQAWLKNCARELDLRGWAENRDYDTVTVHLEGPIKRIVHLAAMARRGPAKAVVAELLTEPVPSEGFTEFTAL